MAKAKSETQGTQGKNREHREVLRYSESLPGRCVDVDVIRQIPSRSLTKAILDSAVKVHRELGPGLLEGTYRTCLLHQLERDGFQARSEVPLPIHYQGLKKEFAYRADIIVEEKVLLELKAVETLLPIHEAQILTYLRHSGLRVGLLMNFNVRQLLQGIRRLVR